MPSPIPQHSLRGWTDLKAEQMQARLRERGKNKRDKVSVNAVPFLGHKRKSGWGRS